MAQAQGWTDPQKPNPAAFNDPDENPNKVDHAVVGTPQNYENSGKEMGHVHAPIVSMEPTSQANEDKPEKKEFKVVDKANFKLKHYIHESGHHEFAYPYADLDVGQGLFIPVDKTTTTDKLIKQIFGQVDQFKKQNSEVERDENGDDVMEDIAINVKKRNEDGTIQLDGGQPRLTVKSGFRPKLVGPTFTVKAVVKDDEISENNKATSDGVLVIRMS